MHRFYCAIQNISQDKIIISDKLQIHHLKDVLRLKPGNEIIIFDDKGNEYRSIIEKLLPNAVTVMIKDRQKFVPALKPRITIACAVPKKSKMDDIVDKLTQLGVERIIPLETERVVIKLDKHKRILRQKRWEKIALSASQQSQRSAVPVIEPIKDIKEVLSKLEDFDLKLIPTLTDERKSLKEILTQVNPKNILILIGPEGDFTLEEIDMASKVGCIPVSLGELVLRVDTAAIAVISILNYALSY